MHGGGHATSNTYTALPYRYLPMQVLGFAAYYPEADRGIAVVSRGPIGCVSAMLEGCEHAQESKDGAFPICALGHPT